MDFKSRVVPLFQFAAFYEDDLEMDSQMPMSVSGPTHTNGDLMAMSYSINQDPSVNPSQDFYARQTTKLEKLVCIMAKLTCG
jgi:hypothetical protein